MKKFYALSAVLVLVLFATSAIAAAPALNSQTATGVIVLNATIQQSASITLGGNEVNFDVTNPSAVTAGDKTISITGKVSAAKGHAASMTITGTDLAPTISAGSPVIPYNFVQFKTTAMLGFAPMSNSAWDYAILAVNNSTAVLNSSDGLTTVLSFQLAPVPTFVPDQYTGTATLTLVVM